MRKNLLFAIALVIVYVGGYFTPKPIQSVPVSSPTPSIKVIVIPNTPFPTPTPLVFTQTPSPTPTVLPNSKTAYYIVQEGDSLGAIALRFGIPAWYLADENGIENADWIFPGEIIVIPVYPPLTANENVSVKKVVVTLSLQTLDYYEDGVLVRTMLVSTGTPDHPTYPGVYKICQKLKSARMTDGITYDYPSVPNVMYICNGEHPLEDGYSLHGTTWHHNFGHVMSHGCVNLSEPDAEWLYKRLEAGQEIIINQ